MKKIIFFLFFLFNISQTFADTTLSWNSNDLTCPSEAGTNSRTLYGIPSSNTAGPSTGDTVGSITCNTHYYYTSSDHNIAFSLNGGQTACPAGEMVVSWNSGAGIITCRKFDDTPPVASDIQAPIPGDGSSLLAINNRNFSFIVSDNGEAPISYIGSYFEDYSTSNSFKTGIEVSNTGTWTFNENIQNVDSDKRTNGSRMYSLRVSRICDEAGNCIGDGLATTDIKTFNFDVYANSLVLGTRNVTTNELDDSSVADGTTKNLTISLIDVYGNGITKASGIGRTVGITLNTDNNLNLNQYLRTGNGIFLDSTTDVGNYTNRISLGTNIDNLLSNQDSTNGIYNYGFKVYTPTQNVYSKAFGNAIINAITASITDSLSLGNNPNLGIIGGTFALNYAPLYYSTLSGDILTDGFIEGGVQHNIVNVTKNTSSVNPTMDLCIEFGSGDINEAQQKLNLKYGKNVGDASTLIGEGNGNCINYASPLILGNNELYTKLNLNPGAKLNDIQKSYLSTHIAYNLDGKSVVYNSDVYGKNNYWGVISGGDSYESVLKVLGSTYTQKYNEILNGQSGNEVKLLNGSITKASFKKDIRSNAYSLIKGLTPDNGSRLLNNLDFASNSDGVKIKQDSIIYFGGLNGANVVVTPGVYSGEKTIIVEGGNLYINGNVTAANNKKDILGIIVLKDDNGNGGNVYINPSVTAIESVIYADKSLISYNGVELGGDASIDYLRNQLYIYGSVFSENTIGGSRNDPPICPYYVSGTCDLEEAQKYDLNYLRRYYLKDTNADGVGDTPASPGVAYFNSSSPNYKYPVVISYNSLIQTTPPPLFTK